MAKSKRKKHKMKRSVPTQLNRGKILAPFKHAEPGSSMMKKPEMGGKY